MKKILAFFLVLSSFIVVLAGCGGGGSGNPVGISGTSTSGTTLSTREVRGKISGTVDLSNVMVYLVAEGAVISPALRAQAVSSSTDGKVYFTSTDANGNFVFPAVRYGTFNLIANKDQFKVSLGDG